MSALKIIVTVIYCIVAIAFTASVLMQEGKSAGLGAIGGMAGGKVRKIHSDWSNHFLCWSNSSEHELLSYFINKRSGCRRLRRPFCAFL